MYNIQKLAIWFMRIVFTSMYLLLLCVLIKSFIYPIGNTEKEYALHDDCLIYLGIAILSWLIKIK